MNDTHALGIAVLAAAMGLGAWGCAASRPSTFGDDDDAASTTGVGGNDGEGGSSFTSGTGGSSSSGGPVTELRCADVQQDILVLDFRSGWWTGGGGGDFADVALSSMVAPCSNITVEYHHFEVDFRVKCLYGTGTSSSCQQVQEAISTASEAQILGWFENAGWDEYTQVWILSGSVLDAADVSMTGTLFDHFLGQTSGSCVPVLIGAGDGFIDHGNSVTAELGLGDAFATELPSPGFFSVALSSLPNYVTIDTRMQVSDNHLLFSDVTSVVDTVSNDFQSAHGDSIASAANYQVLATDGAGRPSIAVGDIVLPGGDYRPFVIDAGFQRYYAVGYDSDTRTLLQNMVLYLGLVGCKADPPK